MRSEEIIRKIVEGIDGEIVILSVDVLDPVVGVYTFGVNSHKWIRRNKVITGDDGSEYKVKEVNTRQTDGVKTIKVERISGSHNDNLRTLTAPPPVFFYGSIRDVNSETSAIKRTRNKTPLIYLEPLRGETKGSKLDRIKRTVPVRLFFLDESNFKDWLTEDYFVELIDPIRPLVDGFINEINRQSQLIDFDEYQQDPVTKFASYDDKGNIKKYLTDDLGGWEIRFDLRVINSENCRDPFRFV